MNIQSCATTFDLEEIWTLTLSLFIDIFNANRIGLKPPYTHPSLFVFYEDFISYPIDGLKDEGDASRIDFYELVLLMSWAIHREWARKVVDEKSNIDCLGAISKNDVIKLFLDNLNCEEGMVLLNKLK